MSAEAAVQDRQEEEVLGIVISRGSRAEAEPRFSAYVWSAGPETDAESTTHRAA